MRKFKDYPEFTPNMTPKECIRAGIFGGCYFNPIGGKPGILTKRIKIDHTEFPESWFKGVNENKYLSRRYDPDINKYKVASGQDQAAWERNGWIKKQDPRGWFQWYCRFYIGRRTDDDERQIKRWLGVAGPNGRFLRQYRNNKDSLKLKQTLLHWAWSVEKKKKK